jgi:hypothetical protein
MIELEGYIVICRENEFEFFSNEKDFTKEEIEQLLNSQRVKVFIEVLY